jgi:hypothetical protein
MSPEEQLEAKKLRAAQSIYKLYELSLLQKLSRNIPIFAVQRMSCRPNLWINWFGIQRRRTCSHGHVHTRA